MIGTVTAMATWQRWASLSLASGRLEAVGLAFQQKFGSRNFSSSKSVAYLPPEDSQPSFQYGHVKPTAGDLVSMLSTLIRPRCEG